MILTNIRTSIGASFRSGMMLSAAVFAGLILALRVNAQTVTQPLVAIHDSELTRALESMPAVPPTPTNNGASGKQWWETDWHYFVMPESLKEAFRSDGTAFTVIGDSNVTSGLLLANGAPKYPIVFSLATAAIRNDEIAQFTNYVAAGGFLFISGPAFTRDTNGQPRGDFAFANQMGLHTVVSGLVNYGNDNTFTRQFAHRLVSHIPDGQVTWRLPGYSEEVNWGVATAHNYFNSHDVWQVQASDATVVGQGDNYPYLTVKQYGKGYFIYEAALNPIVAHGGFGPGMYAYMILRNAVEWAFESAKIPVAKLSPWPYQYDAAMMARHDLEDYDHSITNIEDSAAFEFTNGVKGDYYFCTGTLRVDMAGLAYDTNAAVLSLRRAMTNYGATISSHNGGLKNATADTLNLHNLDYDYWHWGPDEALDFTPAGYANGTVYATTSVSNSFKDIEGWLPGLMTPSMRTWVACNFNATREASYNLQSQLGIKIIGDQKISPFPHWTLSTQTANKRYAMLSEPVSEWFINGALAQSLENWHPPGIQDSGSLHTSVDFYYNLGTLVNFYSHTMSTGLGDAHQLEPDYITYCANTNMHPRLWKANGIGIYQWWLARSNAQINVTFATNGPQSIATFSISGSSDTNTAVELLTPGDLGFCSLQVQTNHVAASNSVYRVLNNQLIRVKVGTAITNVIISYYPQQLGGLVYSETFDGVSTPSLPSGWTTSASGTESPWVTQASGDVANAIFVPDPRNNLGMSTVTSPAIVVPTGQSQLSFRNNYNLEGSIGNSGWDGGVLEIKIGTNAFADIVTAGGSFVTGGYIGSLETGTGNPLGDRPAWTGNSGGYITTIVNLPVSAAGQTNQFRWICGVDQTNSANFPGWRIDSIAITNLACMSCSPGTNGPVMTIANPTNQTINEGSPFSMTNSATDPDSPANILTYTLVGAPATALIDVNGVITWTPGELDGLGTNTFKTVVTDCSGLSATNSFKVFVNEVNSAPSYPSPGQQTVNENTLLTVTNAATDSDIPANTLSYQLVSPLNHMALNSNTGVFTWTPDETQGPSTNTITMIVTDTNLWDPVTPHISVTNSFKVIVNEVNSRPTFITANPTNQTVNELLLLTVTNAATDSDVPANSLSYTLVNPPTGATIDGSGVITWIPSGTQGPSTYTITTVVTDNNPWDTVTPHLSATNSFQVIVNDTATCQYVAVFQENFDGVTAPALPSGWTTSASGVQSNWVTQTNVKDSGINSAFSPDVTAVGSNSLVSPSIATPSGSLLLTFRNNYNFETGAGTDGYDGGVLEIKIGTNAFTDILAAGGSFVSGGYNSVIDGGYSSPIKNRQAWSGNSGGFITTTVSLPSSASSTNVQLRWICGTDSGNGGVGWRIDTLSLSNMVCSSGPVLPVLPTNVIMGEFSTLTVTNTATEPGLPTAAFTYQLIAPPAGATITTNGIITWSPAQTQSPSSSFITTVVTDNSSPTNLSATNSFQVIVKEVNVAPQPPIIGAQTVNELNQLTVNNGATETNIHSVITGYTITSPLSGMTITTNGIFTWTPQQNQSPSTTQVTIVVANTNAFDTNNPVLKATNSFNVFVKEVNVAPTLPLVGDQTINEQIQLTVIDTATETNIHSVTIGYGLINPQSGMTITTNGIFTWTPQQNQSPSSNLVTVVVTNNNSFDTNNPILKATNTFNVFVREVNIAPVLPVVGDQTVNEQVQLTVIDTATEPNVHAVTTGYGLINPQSGMTITSSGVFTWTPQQNQSPSSNLVTVVVTNSDSFDTNNPVLKATNTFNVFVREVNIAPVLPLVGDQTVNEQIQLIVTNTASEPNFHAVTTGYGLINPQSGMTITTNGIFTWTPQQSQSPSSNLVTVVVTNSDSLDTNNPILKATNTFNVFVREVNIAPVLPVVGDQTVNEQIQLMVTNTATEPNVHAVTTGYGLLNPQSGMTITTNGIFIWTPQQNQSPSSNLVTVVVTNSDSLDTNNPILKATNTFNVFVREVNIAPVLPLVGDQTVNEQIQLIVTNTASEPNVHSVTTGYGLINPQSGMTITTNGIFTWTPQQNQSPSANVVTIVVTNNNSFDTNNPVLKTTNTFNVFVREVNIAPVLPLVGDQTVNEQIQLIVTNTATEPNIHAVTTGYGLINPQSGMTITTNGIFIWTPQQNQSPSSNLVTVVVTNNNSFDTNNPVLTATNTFNVFVKEVNIAPVLPNIGLQSVSVLNTLTVTNTATEPNIHATTIGYGLINPPSGATIDANGIITWTPGAGFVGTSNLITTIVTNNDPFDTVNPQLIASNTFQVVVNAVHNGPSLPHQNDVTINELTTIIVTNAANDNDVPFTGLTYQLVNPPAGATIDASGTITWSPTASQSGSTNVITTVVTDGDLSPKSATNSFNIFVSAPVQPPTILSIGVTNSIATIVWSAESDHTYRLQFRDSGDTNWTEVPVNITTPDNLTSGSTASTTNSCGTSNFRLYRISDCHETIRR